jgi:hypothetical protein
MTSKAEIDKSLGLVGAMRRGFDSLCHYNPTKDGHPDDDCNLAAAWHLRLDGGEMLQACEAHLGSALEHYRPVLVEFHEFTGPCGLEGYWWTLGVGCHSVEAGVEMGVLQYVD